MVADPSNVVYEQQRMRVVRLDSTVEVVNGQNVMRLRLVAPEHGMLPSQELIFYTPGAFATIDMSAVLDDSDRPAVVKTVKTRIVLEFETTRGIEGDHWAMTVTPPRGTCAP